MASQKNRNRLDLSECIDLINDSFQRFQTKASSPKHNFCLQTCQTTKNILRTPTHHKFNQEHTFVRKNGFPSTHAKGIMEKNIQEKIQIYKKCNKIKKMDIGKIYQIHATLNQEENIKEKPEINTKSKKLYEKRQKERNLSPHVLDRFEEYEREKSKDKLLKTINRIREVTPSKRITEDELKSFATPRELKYLSRIFNSKQCD